MNNNESIISIASNKRILEMIDEAENELLKLQPEIDYLIQCQNKLSELKELQFKLNSLILSLKSLISNDNETSLCTLESMRPINLIKVNAHENCVTKQDNYVTTDKKVFLPDQAISQVKNLLRTKNNLNYEIFKAIVFNSGVATTKEIKKYLIENNIKQPKSGKSFDDVELKEISSRANYLVRKNILISSEPGTFKSVLGWNEIN